MTISDPQIEPIKIAENRCAVNRPQTTTSVPTFFQQSWQYACLKPLDAYGILQTVMPLPGGPADKFGNRYEGRWTVSCLAEILDERADSIRLEPPGPEGEGVEFWLRKGDIKEYHQVKRQQGSRNHWSISDLERNDVLQTFSKKLSDEKACCVFVSTNATELDELCKRAKDEAGRMAAEIQAAKAGTFSWYNRGICSFTDTSTSNRKND